MSSSQATQEGSPVRLDADDTGRERLLGLMPRNYWISVIADRSSSCVSLVSVGGALM